MKVLRKVEFKIPKSRKEAFNEDFLSQEPTQEDYQENKVESKLLEIDELTNGDFFADYATILKEPIKYSVVTFIPCECYTVHIHDLMELLGKQFVESILLSAKATPEDIHLRKALIERQRWTQFKSEMISSIASHKYNKV